MVERVVSRVLRARAAQGPDEPLVKCGGGWLSVSDVDRISDRLAGGLAKHGVTKGDRIAFISESRQELIELFFACAKLGVVQVPLSTFLKGEFLRYQLVDSGASTVVVDGPGLSRVAPLLGQTATELVILLDPAPEDVALPEAVAVRAFAELSADAAPDVHLSPGDPFSIVYTSGTTGPSKGCVLSNGYYTATPLVLRDYDWIQNGERIFTSFQFFHASAHSVMMQALMVPGASVCFEKWFAASTFLDRAHEEGATLLWCLGPMGMAMLAQPTRPDDASRGFRLAILPAMPSVFQEEFESRFNTQVSSEMYGQTEVLAVTISPVGGPRNRGTLGKPGPHLEVRLVDDDDNEVPVGEVGEIIVRSRIPHGMYSGYWGKPDATLEAWRNLWHHTGDSARADADGFITFLDRKKDSLRRRGENISSFELEAAIVAHPDVAQVAVCAVPSPLGEDDIKACIVWSGDSEPRPADLFDYFTQHLPYFAVPRYVEVRDRLPVTEASGRVKKNVLRGEGITPGTWDLEQLGFSIARSDRR
jgi:crotonobetaine/carnitine-CoA ligase